MAYSIVWHEQILDDLKALDNETAGKIVERVRNHLSQNLEKLGKPLRGVLKGLFRYHWSDYRIIYTIDRADNQISILYIGRRKDVYR